jgi:DNA polymerase elongation subunit (family B)
MASQDECSTSGKEEIVFKASYWNYEDIENDDDGTREFVIYVSGTTVDNKSVFCTIKNFLPCAYLELPQRNWSKANITTLVEYITGRLGKSGAPVKYELAIKKNLYFLKEMMCIKFWFNTIESSRKFFYFIENKNNNMKRIPGIPISFGLGSFKVHEHNIDPIIKFETMNNIKLSSWLSVVPMKSQEDEIEERERYTTCDIDCYADYKDVTQYQDILKQINQKYMAFDIEAYSANHNAKMPDPTVKENVIFQISCIVGITSSTDSQEKKHLFSLDDPIIGKEDEDIHVIKCKTEKELLLAFSNFIVSEDPDLVYGYNSLAFDWNYIITRATQLQILNRFMQISKIIGKKAEIKTNEWSSSAYGAQKFSYPDFHGRVNIDVLIEIQRNYKLPKYTLDYVSEHFLKEHKDDITARQMFIIWKCISEIKPFLLRDEKNSVMSEKELRIFRSMVRKVFPLLKSSGEARKLRFKLLKTKRKDIAIRAMGEALGKIGKYCVKDSILADKLIRFLNLNMVMDELSNYMRVPKSYLHTRGQQIKVMAQIYMEVQKDNILIPYRKKDGQTEKGSYRGAIVFDPKRGYYPLAGISDFESLYPTMIISANIDYTTYIDQDDPISDDLCNLIDCSVHDGCIHDKSKMTDNNKHKSKKKTFCIDKIERFRKVEFDDKGNKKYEGILPRIERKLMSSRKAVKFELFKVESKLKMVLGTATPEDIEFYRKKGWKIITQVSKEKLERLKRRKIILNVQQLVIKVCANSVYGALGAQTGYAPFQPGAGAVTALARWSITNTVKFISETNKGSTLIYGDSVTSDTPILCNIDGSIDYYSIEDIPRETEWKKYRGGKEIAKPKKGIQVWSDTGFTNIKWLIRHKTEKKIFQVLTHTGVVDVTEDHSLLSREGNIVKPKDVKIGDSLLHASLPIFFISNYKLNNEEKEMLKCPYSMGFFYGGSYDCKSGKKKSWALNNTNLSFLTKAKKELENVYPFKFKIYDTLYSSGVYKLEPTGEGCSMMAIVWKKYFYDKNKYKKVPKCIVNCNDIRVTSEFFKGYYDADGDKASLRFDNKGKIGSAGLLFISQKLGFKTSINTRYDKQEVYRVTITKQKQRKNRSSIKKISLLSDSEKYVYDLETENHHFSAGIGELVVHNTDSCIVDYKVGIDKIFEIGEKVSRDTTHHLKCRLLKYEDQSLLCPSLKKEFSILTYPRDKLDELSKDKRIKVYEYDSLPINLQFENVYCNLLMLSKKRYMADVVNKKGVLVAKIKKGNVLVQLGNSKYLRDTYQSICDEMYKNKTEEEINYLLCEWIKKLFSRQIRDIDLVIYTSARYPLNYASKKDQSFIDKDGKVIEDVEGPFDKRLVYKSKTVQRFLSMKMLARGDVIPLNGARLEYVYLKTQEPVQYVGDKAEDYTYYRENKSVYNFRIDRVFYLEKQLTKPIEDLLSAKFEKKVVVLESLQDTIQRQFDNLNDLWKSRIKRTKNIEFTFRESMDISSVDMEGIEIKSSSKNFKNRQKIEYKYKDFDAKVITVLMSFGKRIKNPKIKNELDVAKNRELYLNCLKWRSRQILAKLPGRPKKIYRVNLPKKIKINKCGFTEVCLKDKYKNLDRGTLLRVVEYTENEDIYVCQVYPSERRLKIHKDYFAKFALQDVNIMQRITEYRRNYELLVESLDAIISE